MNHRNPSRFRAPSFRPLCASLFVASLSAAAAAQGGPVFLASTLDNFAGPPFVDDGAIVRLSAGQPARVQFDAGHWIAVAGLEPSDVDALGFRPGFPSGSHSTWAFSLLSDEGGFLDGDVLGFAVDGGVEVLIAEADITSALGVPGAVIDLDALDYDPAGQLLFSLQNDLPGSFLGLVENGDVLLLELSGAVSRLATEADVQIALLAATGLTGAVGDVHGIAWFPGGPWVVTQGPNEVDGGVLSLGGAPAVILDETQIGLGGAELDAIALLDPGGDIGVLSLEPQIVAPGTPVQARFLGASAGDPLLLLWGGSSGYVPLPLPGFGGCYISPNDPFLLSAATVGALPIFVADGAGEVSFAFSAPLNSIGGLGWSGGSGFSFQVLNLASYEVSAPFRMEF